MHGHAHGLSHSYYFFYSSWLLGKKNTVGCASNMYIGKAEQRADAELRQVPRSNSRLRSPRFGDNPYAIYFRSPKLIFRGCARRVLTVRIVASGNRSALAAPGQIKYYLRADPSG